MEVYLLTILGRDGYDAYVSAYVYKDFKDAFKHAKDFIRDILAIFKEQKKDGFDYIKEEEANQDYFYFHIDNEEGYEDEIRIKKQSIL